MLQGTAIVGRDAACLYPCDRLHKMTQCRAAAGEMQGEKSDDSQFQHVYILQEMDEGNARRLRDLDQLLGSLLIRICKLADPNRSS